MFAVSFAPNQVDFFDENGQRISYDRTRLAAKIDERNARASLNRATLGEDYVAVDVNGAMHYMRLNQYESSEWFQSRRNTYFGIPICCCGVNGVLKLARVDCGRDYNGTPGCLIWILWGNWAKRICSVKF